MSLQINGNISHADRYIPRRSYGDFSEFPYNQIGGELDTSDFLYCRDKDETPKYVNMAQKYFNRHKYKTELAKVMLPEYKGILSFSNKSRPSKHVRSELWPNYARKKPLIGPPLVILDMPNLDTHLCHKVIDWCDHGNLATIYEHEVFIWNENTPDPYVITDTRGTVDNCISWNAAGTELAVSITNGNILIWDVVGNTDKFGATCACLTSCKITCLEWSSDDYLVAGCSRGRLSVYTYGLKWLKSYFPAHSGSIIRIKFSANEKYVASCGVDGAVRLWSWPIGQGLFEILSRSPTRGIAWHPWKENLLCTGSLNGSLRLWNINNQEMVAWRKCKNSYIDCVTWNHVTGELVVSFWPKVQSAETDCNGTVSVYSDFDTLVDVIQWHTARVPYLLWGENGTKLATASADENLCVWDFLGTSKERKKKTKRNVPKKASERLKDSLNLFGMCIR